MKSKFLDALKYKYIRKAPISTIQDASWRPNKKANTSSLNLTEQNNTPLLEIGLDHSYKITFGKQRSFTEGYLAVHHNNIWYSSKPSMVPESRELEFIKKETIESNEKWGKCSKINLFWKIPETDYEIITSFLYYSDSQFIVFQTETPTGIPKTENGDFNDPVIKFPLFKNESQNTRILSYANRRFANPLRTIDKSTGGPVCLFDDNRNSVLLSALNDFGTNIIAQKGEVLNKINHFGNIFECGPDGNIKEIPKGYKYSYIMVFDFGINNVFSKWGTLLHQFYDKTWKMRDCDNNVMNSHLGYFTDHGAYYYYRTLPGKKYDETLQAVNDYYTDVDPVPFNYYHMDSWWYPKEQVSGRLNNYRAKHSGGGKAGGTVIWEEDKKIFKNPLVELTKNLGGKPLTAHGRWFDENTEYKKRHPMIEENNWAMPTNQPFWEEIMATAKKYDMTIYEQDWMEPQYYHFSHLTNTVGAHRKWLEDMNKAAEIHDIGIQYCMATPGEWLEAINLSNVVNFRTTRDYHANMDWQHHILWFTQNSLLVKAIGMWPFLDVVFTSKHYGTARDEAVPELKALISALGGGPFAPGDPIGKVDGNLIMKIARKDGLLFKPDRPVTACDVVFIKHDIPYLCKTEFTMGNYRWHYGLALNPWPKDFKKKGFSLYDFDLKGKYIRFNWHNHTVEKITDNDMISFIPIDKIYQFDVFIPIMENGLAIIGNPDHFLTLNGQEFKSISCDENSLSLIVTGLNNDNIKVWVYSKNKPNSVDIDGTDVKFTYSSMICKIDVVFEGKTEKNITLNVQLN